MKVLIMPKLLLVCLIFYCHAVLRIWWWYFINIKPNIPQKDLLIMPAEVLKEENQTFKLQFQWIFLVHIDSNCKYLKFCTNQWYSISRYMSNKIMMFNFQLYNNFYYVVYRSWILKAAYLRAIFKWIMAVMSRKHLGNTHQLRGISHLPLSVSLQCFSSVNGSPLHFFKDPFCIGSTGTGSRIGSGSTHWFKDPARDCI